MENNSINAALGEITIRSTSRFKPENGDYIGEDGLVHCGICKKEKQFRMPVDLGGRIVDANCDCEKKLYEAEDEARRQREREDEINRNRQFGFPDAELRKMTFANDDGKGNRKVIRVAKNYVEKFPEMKREGKGLLLYGTVGTGKTFAGACIANALIEKNYRCLVTNFSRIINTLQETPFDRKQRYLDSLNNFSLIVIDDLGVERDTDYMAENVQNIIDARYRAGLPLIVTTNLTPDQLRAPSKLNRERTYSRLFEMCAPIAVNGNDRRKEKLESEFGKIAAILGIND